MLIVSTTVIIGGLTPLVSKCLLSDNVEDEKEEEDRSASINNMGEIVNTDEASGSGN